MKPDLAIYDGSNFYHGIKRLCPQIHLTGFDYRKLAEVISGGKKIEIEYCVGEIRYNSRDAKAKRLFSGQQKLFFNLQNQDIRLKLGYMLKSNGKYREKGVDVRIALEILRGALKDEYQNCFIISSDTDLIPAIQDARSAGKKVIYVGFKDSLSNALQAVCSKTIILDKKLIKICTND